MVSSEALNRRRWEDRHAVWGTGWEGGPGDVIGWVQSCFESTRPKDRVGGVVDFLPEKWGGRWKGSWMKTDSNVIKPSGWKSENCTIWKFSWSLYYQVLQTDRVTDCVGIAHRLYVWKGTLPANRAIISMVTSVSWHSALARILVYQVKTHAGWLLECEDTAGALNSDRLLAGQDPPFNLVLGCCRDCL